MLRMQEHATGRADVSSAASHLQSGCESLPTDILVFARRLAKPHLSMGLADVPAVGMTRSPCALFILAISRNSRKYFVKFCCNTLLK